MFFYIRVIDWTGTVLDHHKVQVEDTRQLAIVLRAKMDWIAKITGVERDTHWSDTLIQEFLDNVGLTTHFHVHGLILAADELPGD